MPYEDEEVYGSTRTEILDNTEFCSNCGRNFMEGEIVVCGDFRGDNWLFCDKGCEETYFGREPDYDLKRDYMEDMAYG